MNALHSKAFSIRKQRAIALMCAGLLLAGCATQTPDKPVPAKTATTTPAQPVQTQQVPSQPAPTQPAPSQPAPSQPETRRVEAAQPVPTPASVSAPMPAPVTSTAPAPKPVPATVAVKPAPAVAPVKPAPEPVKSAPPAPVKPVPARQDQPAKNVAKTAPPVATQPATTQAIPVPAAESPQVPAPATAADSIAVSLDNLPLSIHNQWTLDRSESRCTLQSNTQRMDDGQGGTRISLWLTATELSFLTESDIDLSYTGTGLTIDGRTFALETVERRTNPVFSKQRSAILAAMKSGQTLQLSLGFWPTWPVTHTYSVSFSLQHFATAYTAWETCNRLLNQR